MKPKRVWLFFKQTYFYFSWSKASKVKITLRLVGYISYISVFQVNNKTAIQSCLNSSFSKHLHQDNNSVSPLPQKLKYAMCITGCFLGMDILNTCWKMESLLNYSSLREYIAGLSVRCIHKGSWQVLSFSFSSVFEKLNCHSPYQLIDASLGWF